MSFESAPFFRANMPARRMLLELPCELQFEDHQLVAKTYDICYGGVGILLPSGTPMFRHDALKSVRVAQLGEVSLDMRWRLMHRVGAAFADERKVKAQLEQFFQTIGQYPG